MAKSGNLGSEFDTTWKVALELFFRPFLELFFPAAHALIDWNQPPVFLDTELQQIAAPRRRGKRTVDKLVRVRLLNGREEWIFIHVEVQSQRDRHFAARMWTYYRRIVDKFGPRVISLAVLADDQPRWKPGAYEMALGGCRLLFEFPIFKGIEVESPEEEFVRTGNPFALVVAAHQAALATRRDAGQRCQERLRLVRYLYRHGLDRETVRHLLRLIAGLTLLPSDWELKFEDEYAKLTGGG